MLSGLLLSILISAPSHASGSSVNHYDLDHATCAQAKLAVAKDGAVIFHFAESFSRVVRDHSFCDAGEELFPFGNVNSATKGCYPGYNCRPNISGGP